MSISASQPVKSSANSPTLISALEHRLSAACNRLSGIDQNLIEFLREFNLETSRGDPQNTQVIAKQDFAFDRVMILMCELERFISSIDESTSDLKQIANSK